MNESQHNPLPLHIRAGQEFMQLYVRNERRIYGFIYTLVHDWSASEDILQESATVMWSKFQDFAPGTDFMAWALRIARYQVLNYWKRQDTKTVFDSELLELLADQAAAHISAGTQRHDALKTCLNKLPERERTLINLRYEMGATVKGVAEKLGWNTKSVYRSLKRIRYQLFLCIQHTLSVEERT